MPMYTFTTTDFHLMQPTLRDINNAGEVVGSFFDTLGREHGYVTQFSVPIQFDDPSGADGTQANGVTAAATGALVQVVGTYFDANNTSHAYLFKFADGAFSTIDDPLGTKGSQALDINAAGQIVGFYTTDDGITHGFRRSAGGAYTTIDNPAGVETELRSINDAGQIVGLYGNATGAHGFLTSNGEFFDINAPSGILETIEGINNAGQITGSYLGVGGITHGFIYDFGANTYITLDDPLSTTIVTMPTGINDAGQIVGNFFDRPVNQPEEHGFFATVGPNPPPPGDTTAVMILRGANTSAVRGQYQIYDLGHNAMLASYQLGFVGTDWTFAGLGTFSQGDVHDILLQNVQANNLLEVYDVSKNNITAAAPLGALFDAQPIGFGKFSSTGETDMIATETFATSQEFLVYNISNNQIVDRAVLGTVGLNWQFSGVGNFNGHGNSDMLLRDSNAGGLQIYNIANNKIIGAAFLGTIGLDWQFSGVGDFIGVPGEGDLLLRNVNTGGLQVYNIANNELKGTAFLGTIGLDWQFAGVAQVNTAGASDLVLRNVNSGAFQVYNIANNQITGSATLGQVGLEWQLGGFAADQPPATAGGSDGSTSQLVQAMAAFGGGAADTSTISPLGADSSQQTLLTTPQHA
jgi:probable HAF family extracellular repeat protein